jgi:hypothetical protein
MCTLTVLYVLSCIATFNIRCVALLYACPAAQQPGVCLAAVIVPYAAHKCFHKVREF